MNSSNKFKMYANAARSFAKKEWIPSEYTISIRRDGEVVFSSWYCNNIDELKEEFDREVIDASDDVNRIVASAMDFDPKIGKLCNTWLAVADKAEIAKRQELAWMCNYARTLESGATIEADRSDGIATVTWPDGAIQTISLNQGDFELLALGADPEAEGWEDGMGNVVCRENAKEAERWNTEVTISKKPHTRRP